MNTHIEGRQQEYWWSMTYLRNLLLRPKTPIKPDMISAEVQSMTLISVSRLQLT